MRVLSVPLGNIPKQIFYPLGQWAFGLLYRRAVREFGRPDVLHAHFTDYGYLACPLARREQLPLVLTEHSSLVNQETLPKDIEQAAKTAFTQADTLIAVSPALAHHMEQHSGRHVEWIPDMVDTELFAYSDRHERQKALEQETDLSEDSGGFSILSCGNLRAHQADGRANQSLCTGLPRVPAGDFDHLRTGRGGRDAAQADL